MFEHFGAFLDERTVPARNPLPFVGVDQCLDRPDVDQLVRLLVGLRIAGGAASLWTEARDVDGTPTSFLGSVRHYKGTVPVGTPVKYQADPDGDVLKYLLVHFNSHDRLVLLTENTRRDVGGLRWLLEARIRPALERHHRDRFGLLVLYKRGRASIDHYFWGVLERLAKGSVPVGFTAERI